MEKLWIKYKDLLAETNAILAKNEIEGECNKYLCLINETNAQIKRLRDMIGLMDK